METNTTCAVRFGDTALFGTCLLDLTVKAEEAGLNLTGKDVVEACDSPDTGGFFLRGSNEWKHFDSNGNLDN